MGNVIIQDKPANAIMDNGYMVSEGLYSLHLSHLSLHPIFSIDLWALGQNSCQYTWRCSFPPVWRPVSPQASTSPCLPVNQWPATFYHWQNLSVKVKGDKIAQTTAVPTSSPRWSSGLGLEPVLFEHLAICNFLLTQLENSILIEFRHNLSDSLTANATLHWKIVKNKHSGLLVLKRSQQLLIPAWITLS